MEPVQLSVEDILENRIVQLEQSIFGYHKSANADDPLPENSVIDELTRVNTYISSAISGRDNINNLNQKLLEVQEYLEPDADLTNLQTDVKLEYITALESVIRESAKYCKKFEELKPVLDHSDNFKNIPEMSNKLEELTISHLKLNEEADEVKQTTRELLSRYNDIMTNISKTLIYIDLKVTKLEEAAESKIVVED